MAAINQPITDGYYTAEASVLKANEEVPYGHVAMQVGGKIRAALTAVAGSKLLGMSLQDLDETTGSDVTLSPPAAFARGLVVYLDAKSGDEPTAANLGGNVALDTSSQVKATVAGDDLTLTCTDIRADGKIGVYIP